MSQTLYKTPFSRAYWKDAVADSKKLRTLIFSALMVAACVALGRIPSIVVGAGGIKISWGFLGRALCALVGGPVNALLFGFVEDTVGYFMNPDGGYNPFYIFTTMLGVFTYALFLYRAEVTVLRVFLAKLFTNIQNVFLQSLGSYLWYSSKGYWVLVGERAIKNAVMLPIQTIMLVALFAALLPILHRMGFLPNQAGRLKLWKRPERFPKQAPNEEKSAP
ncbi:MAG: folate family ECF transporter S component [Clostridiales bacterium]|nr:folate family ECF transporter S component [Clostridiales bacterium]